MPGVYKGSTELMSGDITMGNNNVEIYHGSTKIFPSDEFSVTVTFTGTLTNCSRSATTIVIPTNESRTFTVRADSGAEFTSASQSSATSSHQAIESITESFSNGVFTYTIEVYNLSQNWNATVNNTANAPLEEFTVFFSGSSSIVNAGDANIFNLTQPSQKGNVNETYAFNDISATAKSGFEFTTGPTTSGDTLTGSFVQNDVINRNISGTVSVINIPEFTVTFTPTNNVANTTISINSSPAVGVAGEKVEVDIIVDTNANNQYFNIFPQISGLAYSVVKSTVDSIPLFQTAPNEYITRRTFTLETTIGSSDRTETFTIGTGVVGTTKSVIWLNPTINVGNSSGNYTTRFLSTDPEGEPPGVSGTGSGLNGQPTVEAFKDGGGRVGYALLANVGEEDRDITLTLESSLDSATADATVTQAGTPVVIATGGSWDTQTSKFDPVLLDSSMAGSMTFGFSTTPSGGLAGREVYSLSDDSNISVGSIDNADQDMTITWNNGDNEKFRVALTPQGGAQVFDFLYIQVSEEQ